VLCAEQNLAKYGLSVGGRGAKVVEESVASSIDLTKMTLK
jgi:hypothetical protein